MNRIDKAIEEFRREISNIPNQQQYLGDPPTVSGRGICSFCGDHKGFHRGLSAVWSYDDARQLREFHRNDFGPNGYYSDEPKLS